MSFAFSQVEPETTGQVNEIPTPITDYLAASWQQGWHDSALGSILRMQEYSFENGDDGSPMLDPETANKNYGIGDLKFDEPTRESVAMLLHDRKQAEMDRNFLLSNGASLGRFLPGMATSFIAGMSNPLDLSMSFLPIVGEEKLARAASIMGKGAIRQGMARGLVSVEELARAGVPAPRFVGSMIQGAVGQAAYEVPNMLATWQEGNNYDIRTFMTNVGMGGALAGGLHMGIQAAEQVFRRLTRSTREAMLRSKVEDFLSGRDTDISPLVHVDENMILQKVLAEHDALSRVAAERGVNMDDIREAMFQKYQEYPERAAIQFEDGHVETGSAHFLIDGFDGQGPHGEMASDGFVTNTGRYISRDEAAALVGMRGEMVSENLSGFDEELDTIVQEAKAAGLTVTKKSKNELLNQLRAQRAIEARQNFFKRPEIQELIDRERQRQVELAMDEARKNFDPTKRFEELKSEEIARQVREERPMDREEVEKNLPKGDETDQSRVQSQVEELKQQLPAEQVKNLPEPPRPINAAQDPFKIALECILEEVFRG